MLIAFVQSVVLSGATVHTLEVPFGQIFPQNQIAAALAAHPQVKLVGIVHAET